MKLVIEYDPFGETKAARSAQTAFQILGLPVELRQLKFSYHRDGTEDVITTVKFEEADKVKDADPERAG